MGGEGALPSTCQLQHPFLEVLVLTHAQGPAALTQHPRAGSVRLQLAVGVELLQSSLTWLDGIWPAKVACANMYLNNTNNTLVQIKHVEPEASMCEKRGQVLTFSLSTNAFATSDLWTLFMWLRKLVVLTAELSLSHILHLAFLDPL